MPTTRMIIELPQPTIDRAADRISAICVRQWGDRPSALWYNKERLVRVRLPSRTRCSTVRRRNIRTRWDGRTKKVRRSRWPSTSYIANVLLRSSVRDAAALRSFIEQAIARGVRLIAAVGPYNLGISIEIDQIIVGNKSDRSRSILTTSHDTTRDAIEYIKVSRSSVRFSEVWL